MREKNATKRKYNQLADVFLDWYSKKEKEIKSNLNIERPPEKLLAKLNITEDEFYDIYIVPYCNLNKEDLKIVFSVLATELSNNYLDENIYAHCSLSIKYDLLTERKLNALHWTLFQISLLNIFDLPDYFRKRIESPYKQCYYCGKPDFYKINNKIKSFNKKEVFCHNNLCEKSSNPEKHDDCCYAKWTRKRKTLEKALSVNINLYTDIEDYEHGDLNDNQQEFFDNKLEQIFLNFCEQQYQENLKIDYLIRTEEKRDLDAINLTSYNL